MVTPLTRVVNCKPAFLETAFLGVLSLMLLSRIEPETLLRLLDTKVRDMCNDLLPRCWESFNYETIYAHLHPLDYGL